MIFLSNLQCSGAFTKGLILSVLCISLHGCMKYTYIAKPVDTGKVTNVIKSWTIDDPGLNQFLRSNGIDLQKQVFSLKRLYLTSLYYDPEMLVAYKKWKKAQIVAEQTDYYINPELSIPCEHHSETSGDISEWTIGAVL